MLLLIIVLVLVFGGGGGYYGYSRWGTGGGLGVVGTILVETHFASSEKIRDIVIGMSDGLTRPRSTGTALVSLPFWRRCSPCWFSARAKRHLHGQQAAQQRLADGGRRGAGGCGCVRDFSKLIAQTCYR